MTPHERLRRFVRVRVRKGERLYERGNGARLAEAIGQSPSWVTEFADPAAPQPRYADLDTALKICAHYRVSITAFLGETMPEPAVPTHSLTPHELRARRLMAAMNVDGQKLAVRVIAGLKPAYPRERTPSQVGRSHRSDEEIARTGREKR